MEDGTIDKKEYDGMWQSAMAKATEMSDSESESGGSSSSSESSSSSDDESE